MEIRRASECFIVWFPELEELPRAGIVHRLDKDTSGVLAVARSLKAQANLREATEGSLDEPSICCACLRASEQRGYG